MNKKEFAALVARDLGGCVCCGEAEAISPNHRANRGMGGATKTSYLNKPSNLVTLCSRMNSLIESDSGAAQIATFYGWKVSKWVKPFEIPIFDTKVGAWFILDDSFGRTQTKGK
jgi:hypothetical protein